MRSTRVVQIRASASSPRAVTTPRSAAAASGTSGRLTMCSLARFGMALRPQVGGNEIWSAPRASSPTVAASPSLSCSLAPEPVLRVPPPRRGAGSRGAPPPARPPAREPWPLCRALVPVPEPHRSLLSLPLRASPPRRIWILRERRGTAAESRRCGGGRREGERGSTGGEREGERRERGEIGWGFLKKCLAGGFMQNLQHFSIFSSLC